MGCNRNKMFNDLARSRQQPGGNANLKNKESHLRNMKPKRFKASLLYCKCDASEIKRQKLVLFSKLFFKPPKLPKLKWRYFR
jgi:hypothetical protein